MMYCSKCGEQLSSTAKFCAKCGEAVAASDEDATNFPTALPAHFQPESEQPAYSVPQPEYSPQPSTSKSTFLETLQKTLLDFWARLKSGGVCFLNAAKEKKKTFAFDSSQYTWHPSGEEENRTTVTLKKPFKQVMKEYIAILATGSKAFLADFQNHNPEGRPAPISHNAPPAIPVEPIENADLPMDDLPMTYETSDLLPQTPASASVVPKKKKKRTKKGKAMGGVFLFGGLALIVLAFVLGAGVLTYKWYEVPLSLFRIRIYNDLLLTLLSFLVPVCVYGGGYLTLAGIGSFLPDE